MFLKKVSWKKCSKIPLYLAIIISFIYLSFNLLRKPLFGSELEVMGGGRKQADRTLQQQGRPSCKGSALSLWGLMWHVGLSQVLEAAFPPLGGREDCFVLRLLLMWKALILASPKFPR